MKKKSCKTAENHPRMGPQWAKELLGWLEKTLDETLNASNMTTVQHVGAGLLTQRFIKRIISNSKKAHRQSEAKLLK